MILSLLLAGMGTAATAQNINLPIIQTKYTADPAPYVHNDTVYLYTTHDEDGAEGFLMKDWLLYTSTDMVNWQDRGAVASLKDFKWFKGENGAWAEQVIERNGKWYMYCPIHGHGIAPRKGSYKGMLQHRRFHIVLVGANSGAGDQPMQASKSVEYDGKAVKVQM